MPRLDRSKIQQGIIERLKQVQTRELLPMPHETTNKNPRDIGFAEWKEFHQRRKLYQQAKPSYENGFRQPSLHTAENVWSSLSSRSSAIKNQLDRLPKTKSWMTEDEKQKCRASTKKALVIVLDTFVNTVPFLSTKPKQEVIRGTITYNNVFDAVCRRFSDHHRLSIANSVRDMKKDTSWYCRRDLLLNGININALWDIVVKEWYQSGLNPLFDIYKEYTGHGKQIFVCSKDSAALDEFRNVVNNDQQYISPCTLGIKALFSDKKLPERRPRRRVCAEKPYNEVILGEKSKKLLRLQSQSLLLFDVDAFKKDYEEAVARLESLYSQLNDEYRVNPNLPDFKWWMRRMRMAWSREDHVLYRAIEKGLSEIDHSQQMIADVSNTIEDGRKKWKSHLASFRKWCLKYGDKQSCCQARLSVERIAKAAKHMEEWQQKVRQILTEYDQAQGSVHEYRYVYEQVKDEKGIRTIRSGFDRIINRRYQSLHFWPTHVSSRNINPEDEEEPMTYCSSEEKQSSFRKRWFKARHPETGGPCELVGRDISSSQTQIIAALFGIEELEKLAMGEDGRSFKELLAEWAWEKHRNPIDGFHLNKGSNLAKNYKGPEDPRLQSLCKELWMRTSYGGQLQRIIEDQERDLITFGPGWTRENAECFLSYLYKRFPKVKRFLKACRRIGKFAYKQNPCTGVYFTDPSDGKVVRWNPIARADKKESNSNHALILSLPGKVKFVKQDGNRREEKVFFDPNDDDEYPVDSGRIERTIAPCLIQMLDAYYSTLVMEKLAKLGITDFVGIHDCWLVPEKVCVGGEICNGDEVLHSIMNEAVGEWYEGLGSIYEDLLRGLEPGQRFVRFMQAAKKKWQKRIKQGHKPPVFLAHPSK